MTVGAKLAIGAAILIGATSYVAFLGASSNWQYYLTVDECAAKGTDFVGRPLRVSGRVQSGSLQIDERRTQATFDLQGTQGAVHVACRGPLPDNLAENMDVVVEGRLQSAGQLQGDKLLTRCASKYASR